MRLGDGLWRLAWKEYRVQRSLWLSVLFLTILVQFIAVVASTVLNSDPIPSAAHAVISIVALSVYLLGSGATLFALEHEAGTFEFQRLLPVTAWHVYSTKLFVAGLGGVALFAVLLGVSHAFYIGWIEVLPAADWAAGLLTAAEVFAWAIFFSLLLRHPLRAAVCGIVTMSLIVCVFWPILSSFTANDDFLVNYRSFLGPRIAALGALAVVDTWLCGRWFHGRIGMPSWLPKRRPRSTDYVLLPADSPPADSLAEYGAERPIGFGRLLGITLRQGRWIILPLGILFLWAFVVVLTGDWTVRGPSRFYPFFPSATLLSALAFGLCAFTLDQGSYQFRFYAERGISPSWLWWSRQVVWSSLVILQIVSIGLLLLSSQGFVPRQQSSRVFVELYSLLVMAIMVYTLSQFFAMFLRSTLLAFVVSVFTGVLSGIWLATMVAVRIPLYWSVFPIPIVLLFATWYFAKDWIEERHNLRHWVRLAIVVGLPGLAILTGCAFYRAYQIPAVDPGFALEEYTRPLTTSETETLNLYQQADRLIAQAESRLPHPLTQPQPSSRDRWLAAVQPALPLLFRAHERPAVPVTLVEASARTGAPRKPSSMGNYDAAPLQYLLRLQAEASTDQGKLSEAWHYYQMAFEILRRIRLRADNDKLASADYQERELLASVVRWSAHSEQSKDRLAVALAKLEMNEQQESIEERRAKANHVQWISFLRGDPSAPLPGGIQAVEIRQISLLLTLLPWEKARLERLLNVYARTALDGPFAHNFYSEQNEAMENWARTTFLSHAVANPAQHSVTPTDRRATRILVALMDWRREQGSLPSSLAELVGPYFRELPLDPVTQHPFLYSTGLPAEVRRQHTGEIIMPAATPFLAAFPLGTNSGDVTSAVLLWRIPVEP